jgi:hypothetical protein
MTLTYHGGFTVTEEDRREKEQLDNVIKNWLAIRKRYRENKLPHDGQYLDAQREAVKARAILKNKFNQPPSFDDDDEI